MLKPYQVWVKQANAERQCLFSSHSYKECEGFALDRIVHGNNVERIEICDPTGPVCTIYEKNWLEYD